MGSNKQFFYGGQAVIEGVMMRGAHRAAVAVRDAFGNIQIHEQPLNATLYRGRIARTPFVRGLVGLWDALGLGTKALMWSADVAIQGEEEKERQEKERKERAEGSISAEPGSISDPAAATAQAATQKAQSIFAGPAMAGVILLSLALGIGLFIVLPVWASTAVSKLVGVENVILKNLIEETIKISLFLGYLFLIGMMEDVKRLFRYHGAEHKTINAYEAGAELTPEIVQTYPIEHPRCGTAFLLNVIILSIITNSIIGRPDNVIVLTLARVTVIPIIAGVAYEWLRFTANHIDHPLVGILIKPNLLLQRMTTREPDLSMLEVAIKALERVLVAEGLQEDQPVMASEMKAEAVV